MNDTPAEMAPVGLLNVPGGPVASVAPPAGDPTVLPDQVNAWHTGYAVTSTHPAGYPVATTAWSEMEGRPVVVTGVVVLPPDTAPTSFAAPVPVAVPVAEPGLARRACLLVAFLTCVLVVVALSVTLGVVLQQGERGRNPAPSSPGAPSASTSAASGSPPTSSALPPGDSSQPTTTKVGGATPSSIAVMGPATIRAVGGAFLATSACAVVRLRAVDASETPTVLAGSVSSCGYAEGIGPGARFQILRGLCVDEQRGWAIVPENGNYRVRRVNLSTGATDTIAGSGAAGYTPDATPAADAKFGETMHCVVQDSGAVLVVDYSNGVLRLVSPSGSSWVVSTFAGDAKDRTRDGPMLMASFFRPVGLTLHRGSGTYYVSEFNSASIRRIRAGAVTTLAGRLPQYPGDWGRGFSEDGVGAAASFNVPYGIDVSAAGDVLYVADLFSNRLRRVDTATGDVPTLPPAFTLNWPHDAVIDVAASTVSTIVLLVPDLHNNRIVRQPVAAPQAAS